MSQELFSILAVCTGNVCRSPAVERLLASQAGANGEREFCGHPRAGRPSDLRTDGGASADSGVEPDPFEARRLSEQMLKEADLVLSMTRAQRGLVVELWPAAVRRTFTLREFARLLSWVDPSALPAGRPPSD